MVRYLLTTYWAGILATLAFWTICGIALNGLFRYRAWMLDHSWRLANRKLYARPFSDHYRKGW